MIENTDAKYLGNFANPFSKMLQAKESTAEFIKILYFLEYYYL